MDYQIFSDSTTDLTKELESNLGIITLPLKFKIDGKEYNNYLDERELSLKDFYSLIRKGNMPTTSLVNSFEYKRALLPFVSKNIPCLVLTFSSALSGTYNSALNAKEMLEEEYPNAKIHVIDTKCAAMGEGLLVYLTCKNKEKKMSLEENIKWIMENREKVHHWFTVDDIDYLKKGGRLSNSQAFVAKRFKIKPILKVDVAGKLTTVKKAIGRGNAITDLVKRLKEYYDGESPIFIGHGDDIDDCNKLVKLIRNEYPKAYIEINYVGPVIGSHTGPNALLLFFKSNVKR